MSDPHILERGHAPTPFTAVEIRDACPRGRTIRLLVEPAGEEAHLRVTRYLDVAPDGATQRSDRHTIDGELLEEGPVVETSWIALQAHASFPEDVVVVSPATHTTDMGTFECLLYTVDDGRSVARFWFARDLPGMPIVMETEVGGTVVFRMTMLGQTVEAPS